MKAALLMMLTLVTSTLAQEVAHREFPLRQKPPSTASTADSEEEKQEAVRQQKECPDGFKVINSDGVVTGHKGDRLQVTITSVEPRTLKPNQEFVVVVRLKNTGSRKIYVPWQTMDDPRPRPKDAAKEQQEDTGYFTVNLGTGDKRGIGTAVETDTDLFGKPGEKETYRLMSPGEWITFRISAAVRCKFPDDQALCAPFVSDSHAVLTASWTESLYTTKRGECSIQYGAFTRREAESRPFSVAVTNDSLGTGK